jgi:hypothetical protein
MWGRKALICAAGILLTVLCGVSRADGAYRNFKAAIYVTANSMRQLRDPRVLEQQFGRVSGQLRFDKVYLEVFRSGELADESSLESIKKFFIARGIAVSAGVALEPGSRSGQFTTFDYEDAHDRETCRRAVELAARHFDEVILDDFFFYTTKSDADIQAKGARSWTRYRLEKMREVAENLVLKPARAANPRVRVIIKFPNWYEHFQGLGYDLDVEAKKFDSIYTGTETRDPEITDQLLQQYESYLVFRYYDNVRPNGVNRGGWVDTYATRYVDRYAEQLWDTLFAKAPEITLFNWSDLAATDAAPAGERQAWSTQPTSFNWDAMVRFAKDSQKAAAPGWARVAGYSLDQVDRVVGRLGKPLGIASYKPYQSSGEDFLHDYLGNLGLPIELTPEFPTEASLVLLTESARQDPRIVPKIRHQLVSGKSVVITSGLLRALQGRGIEDLVEVADTGNKIAVHDFFAAYGAGKGASLNEPGRPARDILFPQIRFYTNDSWPLIRGVANARGVPILLLARYSRGVLYVLNIPDNPGDLYELPQPVTKAIRSYLQPDFPVRLDAPARVSLFAYDNGTFIVESFRPDAVTVKLSIAGAHTVLHDLMSTETARAEPVAAGSEAASPDEPVRTSFQIQLPPHSYRVFSTE